MNITPQHLTKLTHVSGNVDKGENVSTVALPYIIILNYDITKFSPSHYLLNTMVRWSQMDQYQEDYHQF